MSKSNFKSEKYFTMPELASYLGVHREKAYQLIYLPEFPFKFVRKRYYINKEQFFQWQSEYKGVFPKGTKE